MPSCCRRSRCWCSWRSWRSNRITRCSRARHSLPARRSPRAITGGNQPNMPIPEAAVVRPKPELGQLAERRPAVAALMDWGSLLKPRVVSLVVFTGAVGVLLAPGPSDTAAASIAVLCIALGAGAAGALNMWYDRDIDA